MCCLKLVIPRTKCSICAMLIFCIYKQDAHQLVGQAKRCATKIRPKVIGSIILDRFSNVENFRPVVDSDVISGVVVEPAGVKVRVTYVDSRSNCSRDIRLPHFVTNDDNDDAAGRRTLW